VEEEKVSIEIPKTEKESNTSEKLKSKRRKKSEKFSEKSKSRSKPKKKLRSKKDIKPIKGGYLSRYANKLDGTPNESNTKKMPRFSSRARKPRNSELNNFSSNPQNDQFKKRNKQPPKKPSNFIRDIFSKPNPKIKNEAQDDIKIKGSKLLDSIASLGLTGEGPLDFSMTVDLKSSKFTQKEQNPIKKRKRKSKRDNKKREQKKVTRKSRRDSYKKREKINNTSLEEKERTPPRIELARKDYNIPSRSQAPKKIKSLFERTSTYGSREMSLGPSKGKTSTVYQIMKREYQFEKYQ
jgi:hypothetical protein